MPQSWLRPWAISLAGMLTVERCRMKSGPSAWRKYLSVALRAGPAAVHLHPLPQRLRK